VQQRGDQVAGPVLVGIGNAAQLDEGLFHQLLHCHHLDDRTGLGRALVFDGALVLLGHRGHGDQAGDTGRVPGRHRRIGRTDLGLLLAGVRGFNLFDGVVDHKWLRLHQVRQGVAVARRRGRSRSGR
jgi:uncharacterized membrane protein